MTSNPFQEGRTRSQIKLSDDILKVPEQSPMKNARDAARKKSDSPGNMDPADGSEDELLLSPSKQTQPPRSKRSVSPPQGDEYNRGASEGREGRELKRMKREMDERETRNPVKARVIKGGHARINSEPNAGRKAPRKRAGTASSNNKPNSTSNVPTFPVIRSPARAPGKTRAQSVPLFPSFSPLPSLDLRNPPLSPIRARSPSRPPSKYHGLKIHPSPSKPELPEQQPPLQAEVGPDEPKVPMDVDEEPPELPVVELDAVMENVGDPIAPSPEVIVQPPQPPTPPAPSTAPPAELPATPAPNDPALSISMSPLTPLPDTPLAQKVAAVDNEDRYKTDDGWGFDLEKESEAASLLQPIPPPEFGQPKNMASTSKLPNATSRSQIPRPSLGPVLQPLSKTAPSHTPALNTTATEKLRQPSLKITAHKGSTSSGNNAFTFLMKNAGKQDLAKPQDKGKGKAASLLHKTAPAVASSNVKGKEKAEPEVKKPSMKDRMRRNEKPKPAAPAKFVPLIFDEDEGEQEPGPEDRTPPTPVPGEKPQPSSVEVSTFQEEPQEPIPPLVQESSIAGSSNIQTLEEMVAAEPRASTENILQLQPTSPISSITSLSDSEPESARLPILEGPVTPVLTVPEKSVVPQGEEMAPTPMAVNLKSTLAKDTNRAEMEVPLIDDTRTGPPEPQPIQIIQEPQAPLQIVQEALASQTRAAPAPAEQPAQPIKPKPAPKKRGQSNIPTSTRVTRSAFKPPAPPSVKPPTRRAPRQATAAPHKPLSAVASREKSRTDGTTTEPEDQTLLPGSPMQTSSPLQTPSRGFRTSGSSPAKISLVKTPSKPNFSDASPSPTKIARAVSMFSRPSDIFSVDDIGVKPNGSSLSTLSNALEKLKMPVPSRPNTSLGFNPSTGEDDDEEATTTTFEQSSQQPGGSNPRPGNSRRRSFSIGHDVMAALSKSSTTIGSSSTQTGPSTNKPRMVQRPVTMFFSKPGSSTSSAKSHLLGVGRPALNAVGAKGKGKGVFGIGGFGSGGGLFPMANKRAVKKVSKKTSLPMVEASPVKGGGTRDIDGEWDDSINMDVPAVEGGLSGKEVPVTGALGDVFTVPLTKGHGEDLHVTESGNSAEKSREREKDKSWKDSSRRASLALSQLSQSLSAAPAYGLNEKGGMGPPATPRKIARSASSNYPTPSGVKASTPVSEIPATNTATPSRSSTSPDKIPPAAGTRFSVRRAAKVVASAGSQSPSTSAGPGGSGKKASAERKDKEGTGSAKKAESLKILKDCVIFVDVRADDGEEAGSLFVEMLEGLGAKILTRVGQTCTHVIFKNGLMSTTSRYRLLREPKPSVVGIAWVVDCVEQRRRVEETPYLIDLNEINVAGTNKRRRSMLPKLMSGALTEPTPTEVDPDEGGAEADVSMDGSQSSITLDDDLTPLERARRRRSMIFGPPA